MADIYTYTAKEVGDIETVYKDTDRYIFTYNGVKYNSLAEAVIKTSYKLRPILKEEQIKQNDYLKYLLLMYPKHRDPHFAKLSSSDKIPIEPDKCCIIETPSRAYMPPIHVNVNQ